MSSKGKGFFKGQEFSFDLPEGWNLLAMAEPKEMCGMDDVGMAVLGLLDQPIGMAPLADIVKGMPHQRTVIISEDQTRPTPVGQILIPVLNELNRLGIPDDHVDVIIGRGTHRLPTDEEIRESLAETVNTIVDAVRTALERTPPELSADIIDKGILLAGGGSLLRNLDQRLREETGIPVAHCDDPVSAVVRGTGLMLTDIALLRKISLE